MYTSVSLTPTFFTCWGAHGLKLTECIRIMVVSVCQVRPGCFLAENPLWLVGAPVRLAASLRLLARERISRYGYSCFLHRVFRERWVAGRSAGPLSGVASLAGPPAVLWFFQAPGARNRTHGSGGSADLAGKWRSRESMGPRLRLPAECARLWRLLRRLPRLRPFRMPRTPGTRKIETKTHTNKEHAR